MHGFVCITCITGMWSQYLYHPHPSIYLVRLGVAL